MKIKHERPSPFPLMTVKGVVVDETCQCGHRRSHHRDTIAYGHGACATCACDKFKWDGSVMKRRND